MRLTQGCFSFLPDLTDAQIEKQVAYAMAKGWAMNVEWTDDPHPRNNYWELWGLPSTPAPSPTGPDEPVRDVVICSTRTSTIRDGGHRGLCSRQY